MKIILVLLFGVFLSILLYVLEKDSSFEAARREPQSQGLLFKNSAQIASQNSSHP